MSEIKVIHGGISTDYRGQISHVNSFDMSEIERFYIIYQNDTIYCQSLACTSI